MTYPDLLSAVRFLAARCDGAYANDAAGFNKLDAAFGHSLAGRDDWTPRQAWAAWLMLRRYRGQLADGGIDYDKLTAPSKPDPKEPRAEKRVVLTTAGNIAALSPYDADLIAWYREVRAFRWDKETRAWVAPPSADLAQHIITLRDRWGFEIAQNAIDILLSAMQTADTSRVMSQAASSDFDVPGLGGTLRPFQRAGVEYAIKHGGVCFLAEEMGLGKTIEALAILQALNSFPTLVICPAVVKQNWAREAQKWLPGKSVAVLNGNGKKNHTSEPANSDISIINFDLIWREQYITRLSSGGFKAIVIDESHYAKERKSKRSQACKQIAQQSKVRLLLTGTPVLNRPAELVSQLTIAGLIDKFGGAWAFLQHFCNAQQTAWGWDFSGASNIEELNRRLREIGFIRRTKEQVLPELPPKQHTALPVQIDNRAEYDEAEDDIIAYLETIDYDKATAAERAQHLVKIEVLKQLTAQGKLASITEWVTDFLETEQKLVMFASHIAIQDALLAAFPQAAHIQGDDSDKERQDAVDRFQTDLDCRLIVVSLKAGGVGITLTAASNVAFCEYGWTPADMTQAEDRLHRIGQHDSVNVWQFVGQDTIDEQILALLASKKAVVDAVTEGTRGTESIARDLIAWLKARKER